MTKKIKKQLTSPMKTLVTKRKEEWFDNDTFWEVTYKTMFPVNSFMEAKSDLKPLLKLIKPQGKSVLDLCCGPGRFAVPLAQNRYNVTGVDLSSFLLNKGKAYARKSKVKIEWLKGDMRDFNRPDTYDLAINMFTSFGFFENKNEDMLVLRNMFTSLRPGGSFLIDMGGKERLARIFQPTVSYKLTDGTLVIHRHKIFDNFTRIRNEWIFIRNGKSKEFEFQHTIYSGQEILDRFEQAGFKKIRLYGSLDGQEYGIDSKRLIIVGVKPI